MPDSRSRRRPLLLLSNDDGVHAAGLQLLCAALARVGDVVVCAPERQQSAISHGITLSRPLRLRRLGPARYAVDGKPVDAVFLGINELCDGAPDLVVSGINHGANLGTDVLYSGTVAAAMEAAIHGIPALAVSQLLPRVAPPAGEAPPETREHSADDGVDDELERYLRQTAELAAHVAEAQLAAPLPPGTVLNLNGPTRRSSTFAWTRLGRRYYRARVLRREDPRGVPYYWIGGAHAEVDGDPGSDAATVAGGVFSLTALRLDWSADLAGTPPWRLDGYTAVDAEEIARGAR